MMEGFDFIVLGGATAGVSRRGPQRAIGNDDSALKDIPLTRPRLHRDQDMIAINIRSIEYGSTINLADCP